MNTQPIVTQYDEVQATFSRLLRLIKVSFADPKQCRAWSDRLVAALDCGTVQGQQIALDRLETELTKILS